MEYPKIETLYVRDKATFKVDESQVRLAAVPLIKEWVFTEKIDGTNIRIMWNHISGQITFGGRTDKAQLPQELLNWLITNSNPDSFKLLFPDKDAIIYGEGYGPKIQSGGYYSDTQKFIAFDIKLGNRETREFQWASCEAVEALCECLGYETVPSFGSMTLEDATAKVKQGFNSMLASKHGVEHPAEGLVGRTDPPLFTSRGDRLIIKIKTKDF